MKMRIFRNGLPAGLVGGLLLALAATAQDDLTMDMSPALNSGAAEVMKLSQAKVSDDTIIAYIKNGGKDFALNADQILYLRQAGVSEAVITVMLNQPKTGTTPPAASELTTPTTESSADYGQTEPYYSSDNAPYYPGYYYYPAYGYYNWSYPFYWPHCWGSYYWPYCWGGYWNGYWTGWWNGQPCYWRHGFCAGDGNAFVHKGGGTVWHGNTGGWRGNAGVWNGNGTFRHGNSGMWTGKNGMGHGNTAFRHGHATTVAPTSKIVWLDGAGALGSSPDSMRRNIGVLGGTPNSMQRNMGVLGSGPTTHGAVGWHNNAGAGHGNANVNRGTVAPVMRGNVMPQGGGGLVGKRR